MGGGADMLLVLTPESMLNNGNSGGESIDGDYPLSSMKISASTSNSSYGYATIDTSGSMLTCNAKTQPNGNVTVTMNGFVGLVDYRYYANTAPIITVSIRLPDELSDANVGSLNALPMKVSAENAVYVDKMAISVSNGTVRLSFRLGIVDDRAQVTLNNLLFTY